MKNFNQTLLFLSVLFILSCTKKKEIKDEISTQATPIVQPYLNTIEQTFKTGGAVAAIRNSDGSLDYGAIGKSDDTTPLSKDMSLGIGSITKTFTSVLIFKLIEKGELSLNHTLAELIPNSLNTNIDGEITVEQLLNHSSGLYNPVNDELITEIFANPSHAYSLKEFLELLKAPVFKKGTEHGYSNTNYTLLGLIIEAKTGIAYHEHLRAALLNPLNLKHSFLSGKEAPNNSIAHSYGTNGKSLKTFPREGIESVAWASGSLFSSVADLTKMFQELFKGSLLSEASLTKMTSSDSGATELNFGYGIFKGSHKGTTTYFHSGQTIAYNSFCVYDDDTKSTLAVVVNQTETDAQEIALKLLDKLKNQ